MPANSVSTIVVPLIFRHGRPYEIMSYAGRLAIQSRDDDFDGWGRSWSLGERSGISTSRANHVEGVHVSASFREATVVPPINAVEVDRDIHVGLVWGDTVGGLLNVGDDETVAALAFGEREVATWQHLEGSRLWLGSDISGHLAQILVTCPTRKPREVSITFCGDLKYEASLYGDISFDFHASEPFDEVDQIAMHDQWIEQDDNDVAPSCGTGIHLESDNGDADLSAAPDGTFSYFNFNGQQEFGTVEVPKGAERVETLEVKTVWPTSVKLLADTTVEAKPKIMVDFGGHDVERWAQLGDEGPWAGTTVNGNLARFVLIDVRWQSKDMYEEDAFDLHSPEHFEMMLTEQEARQDKALQNVSFAVYGLAQGWSRERSIRIDNDEEPTARTASVELTYGTQRDLELPYVEVSTTNEPWRVAELKKNKPSEWAFQSVGWLSHLTRLPIEEHESRAEAEAWFAEGSRLEDELSQQPWDEHSVVVDGIPHDFHILEHQHGWIARGVVGDLAVDVKVLNIPTGKFALETVKDLAPFIQGRRDQVAELAEKRKTWASLEDHVPDWAKDARREAQRAAGRILNGFGDNHIAHVLDSIADEVFEQYGGRESYRSLISLYIAARGFSGHGTSSNAWVNEDGSLVGVAPRLTLAPENDDEGGGGVMIMSSGPSDEPEWWGLSDDAVVSATRAAAGDPTSPGRDLSMPLLFRREPDGYKLVSDIIATFEQKMGDPASAVKPR